MSKRAPAAGAGATKRKGPGPKSYRLAWATDVHLNFAAEKVLGAFLRQIAAAEPDLLLLSGDLAEADCVLDFLALLARELPEVEIAYVLGNHDYYGATIDDVRSAARKAGIPRVRWLHGAEPVRLTARTALVGCDGWGDGRLGAPATSPVLLADWSHIHDFAALGALRDRRARLGKLAELGDESARALEKSLTAALADAEHVVVLTHVPPFAGATWHEGQQSNDDWLPWFSCRATGDVLERAARAHPLRELTVVCGHTHSSGLYQPLPNLTVKTGAAKYGAPELCEAWAVE